MQARIVPGYTKTDGPDDVAWAALAFVHAVRDGNHPRVWGFMTNESKGLAAGYWIATQSRDLRDVYEVSRSTSHPEFQTLVADFCQGLKVDWGGQNLEQLGALPTKYLDSGRALVRLVIGVSEPRHIEQETAMPMILVPMQLEDSDWKFHLPGQHWMDE